MKKFLQFVFNFFWVLIVGISSAISSALTGVACLVTIVGIPFGLQHFKFIPLVFAPAGKTVINHYGSHPVMNTFWLLFGGLATSILYILLSLVCGITIIGIPLASQLLKIAKFNFAPFGVEIVGENEFTSKRNTNHDCLLVGRRIVANPDVVLVQKEDGTSLTAREYFAPLAEKYNNFLPVYKKYVKYNIVGFIFGIIMLILAIVFLTTMDYLLGQEIIEQQQYDSIMLYALFALILCMIVLLIGHNKFISQFSDFCKLDNQYIAPLTHYFEGNMSAGSIKKYTISGGYRFSSDNVWAGVYRELYAKENK